MEFFSQSIFQQSHSHENHSHYHSHGNLLFIPIPTGIPWDSHSHGESHSHAHLYYNVSSGTLNLTHSRSGVQSNSCGKAHSLLFLLQSYKIGLLYHGVYGCRCFQRRPMVRLRWRSKSVRENVRWLPTTSFSDSSNLYVNLHTLVAV